MRRTALALGLILSATASQAQTTLCRSTTYCDDALSCRPTSNLLTVVRDGEGTVTLSWDDAFPFAAELRQDGPTTIIVDVATEGTGAFLMIGESGEGIFATATDFDDGLVAGIYALTCDVAK